MTQDITKLSLEELCSEITKIKKENNDELLTEYETFFNKKKEHNELCFKSLYTQIDNEIDTIDLSCIDSTLYDINFISNSITIYEYAIIKKNEAIFNQLFDHFEDTISIDSIGKGGLMIIEMISFIGFSINTIEKVFKKMNPNYISYYRNKIIYIQSLLKNDNMNSQDLYDFYRVLAERVNSNIFNNVTINAYQEYIINNNVDDIEELIQDLRTDLYLNRIYKMIKPKKSDNDYAPTLLYLSIIFYELKKTIEIVNKEDEEDKKNKEEENNLMKQPRIKEIEDDIDI